MIKKTLKILIIVFFIIVLTSCKTLVTQLFTSDTASVTTFTDTNNSVNTTGSEQDYLSFNLKDINLKEIIQTIIISGFIINILGVLITCLIVFLKDKLINVFGSAKKVIELSLKYENEYISKNLKYGILHVMDGKDDIKSRNNILHKVILYKLIKKENFTIESKDCFSYKYKLFVDFNRRLGMQFKCFVDFKDIDFQEVVNILEQNGFIEISKGQGKENRAWFIHPDYPIYVTNDPFINNFIYPQ